MRFFPVLFSCVFTLLEGCNSHTSQPDFTASGYLADHGSVRIWRKNYQAGIHLLKEYTPFSGHGNEQIDYRWLNGKLVSVEHRIQNSVLDSNVTLRFDNDGKLSFMQRQLPHRREALSDNDIVFYQFDAKRLLHISNALLKGEVKLYQGKWQHNDSLMSCQQQIVRPQFDNYAYKIILQSQRQNVQPVSVAWLEAPQGIQLLLVTPENLCASEVKESDF